MASDREITQAVEDAIDEWLDDFVDKIFEIAQRRLVAEDKIDTSTMLRTANIERKRLMKSIVYPTPYSSVVHDGRMPGSMPPSDELVGWVKRKLGVDDKEARRVAFAIARSIKLRGIEALPFLEESMYEAMSQLE